jgi:hypothetical protein
LSDAAKLRVPSKYILKNMAEERQGRIPNVQDFVQSILSVATNLQHSSQTCEENASQGGSVQQFTSLPEELNSRFRIPHTQNSCVPNNASVPQPAFQGY